MAKEIKIKIPSFKEIVIFIKHKFNKLFSWSFSYIKQAIKIVLDDVRSKKWRGLIALALAIGAYFVWGLSSSLLWLLFLLFLVYKWDNRIIGVFALISLATCPFLLSLKKEALAETMAVYAYFFLVMTVVLQIVEYKRHPDRFPEEESEDKK